jgi:hypothetical protein
MAGGISWTPNWLTFDNSYYTLNLNNNSTHNSIASLNDNQRLASTTSSVVNTPRPVSDQQADVSQTPMNRLMQSVQHISTTASTMSNISVLNSSVNEVDKSELCWFSTDAAMAESSEFAPYFRYYAQHPNKWRQVYAQAHAKFCLLGAKLEPPGGIRIDVPS